jgi:hypothetical protein
MLALGVLAPQMRWGRRLHCQISMIRDSTKWRPARSFRATKWTIPSSLPLGAVYTWQVTAIRDGVEVKSPVQPAPEARFKILEQAKVDELERVRRAHPNSHSILGTLYAEVACSMRQNENFGRCLQLTQSLTSPKNLLRRVRR